MFGWMYCASVSSYCKDVVSEIMACVGIGWDKSQCAGSAHHVCKVQFKKYGMVYCTQSQGPK